MIIIIPAYEPESNLVKLVEDIADEGYAVIVVNDGSSRSKDHIFEKIKENAIVLTSKKNKGKGAAMKMAMDYVIHCFLSEDGVVFMDGDGQHEVEDMKKVVRVFNEDKDHVVLGSRDFVGDIPFKSKMGNKITRTVFRTLSGMRLKDTQTGLRALPARLLSEMIEIPGNRYEYEMNMLLSLARSKEEIRECDIKTLYKDRENSTSHFRPVIDSLRIYGVIFKFMLSSLSCGILDYVIFFILVKLFGFMLTGTILIICNCIARVISATANYKINKNYIFNSTANPQKTIVRYVVLAICILCANSVILYILAGTLLMTPILAKIITECVLFSVSFIMQQRVVFSD